MQSTERMAFDRRGSTCHSRKEGHLAAGVCGSRLDAEVVLFSLFLLFSVTYEGRSQTKGGNDSRRRGVENLRSKRKHVSLPVKH